MIMKRYIYMIVALMACSVQLSAKSFFSVFTQHGSLFITSIAHDAEHLYVGTTAGIVTMEKASGLLTSDKGAGSIFSLAESDGSLWLGQEGMRATSYFEKMSLCFSKYDTWNVLPEESFVSSIAIGEEGQKAFTAWDYLLTCGVNDTTCWRIGAGYTEGMPEEVRYDSKGTLWLVCSGYGPSNLRSYTPEGGLKDVLADYDDYEIDLPYGKRGISSECLVIDANDHLWIGAKGGYLVEFDGTTFQVHRSQIGMTKITDLTIGENGLLWILAQTNSGQQLVGFDGQKFSATALNLSDGERADCIHADGPVVYVGTNKRLMSICNEEVTTILSLSKQYYYYYQGNKIPLTLNENKVVVSIPEENKEVSERIRTNVQTLASISDNTYDIFVISRTEYEKLTTLDSWADDAKLVILTSSYYTENNEEVFSTPYLNVCLKKEEDIDLLTSYAEQYKLVIVSNSPLMPLWYILAVTPESEKSSLDCANELYESGNFASSVPDLASVIFPEIEYRPFVEEGKVWTIKVIAYSWDTTPEEWTEYYYLEGDTVVNGQMAKRMLCDRTGSSQDISGEYVGACYEQDKKVYYSFYNGGIQFDFEQLYDFTLSAGDTIFVHGTMMVVNKLSGGIPGFKGTYYDFGVKEERWLEGVGSESWPWNNHPRWANGNIGTLLSCRIGDEVIYYNSEVEDPYDMGAPKQRFDFTHTVKTKPKAPINREKMPMRRADEESLYGEYNEQLLGINLDSLDDDYQVNITDETGKIVYEKNIDAGNIVALNIDISTYAEGRYTVTVENSQEIFTGEFETQTTGIEDNVKIEESKYESIYNLQGQRLSSLQKGLNIVNGQKVYVR